jgi:RNA polymerase sigma-70 factor (ECF subfamily)
MALFSDEQLGLGIQQGRVDDLTLLVERYHASLLGLQFHLTSGDRALSEDLVQETFLRVISNISSYRYPRPFKPWLYSIAVNLARDHYKQAEFRHTGSMPVNLEISTVATPETELLIAERERQVLAAMNLLPALQREVIILRYSHDLSLKEISQVLHVPLGTVKSRLSLGLQRLKEKTKANP